MVKKKAVTKMNAQISLDAGRSTKLFRNNLGRSIEIEFIYNEENGNIKDIVNRIMIIKEERLDYAPQFIVNKGTQSDPSDLQSPTSFKIVIEPEIRFMVINNSSKRILLKLSEDPETLRNLNVVYDPYLFENKEHKNVDAEAFKKDHEVLDGYIDTLQKWYSVKYTYSDYNLIFIKPGLGISFQTHKLRKEAWEVVGGHPIIVSGNKVFYNTKPGDKFQHDMGALHTIINPTDEWVSIIERYEGTFDEKDIERVFNPNHYIG